MTTRGQINSNFYQIVTVDVDGNPTEVKPEYIPNIANANYANNAGHANVADVANSVSVGNVVGIGNIATINLNGNGSQLLAGNGAWVAQGTTANANYANFAGNAFSVDAGNIVGTVNLANFATTANSVAGANVTGIVANANYSNYSNIANTANSVAVANVSGIGNIATINLNGNGSQILAGNGAWINTGTATDANFANYAGNITVSSQPNITSVGNLIGLQFNNTVTPVATPNIGEMFWDTSEHTVTLGMENGVKQQIGLESYIWVKASATITNGQVVMFTGATGDNVQAAPANVAVAGFRAGYVLGVATQDIANNGFGYITSFGQVHGLNTNAYNVGDLLWLNPAVVGGLTATQPSAPNYQIQIATVTKKSGGDGHIQIIIRPEPQLKDISDVTITTPSAGQALVYNGSNVWINGVPAYANTANSVAVANVSGIGNIATINLTGSSSNVLYGNGVFAPAAGGGTPGGSNTQVQYNNNGSFGGVSAFTFNNSSNTLLVTNANVTGNLTVGANLRINTIRTTSSVVWANVNASTGVADFPYGVTLGQTAGPGFANLLVSGNINLNSGQAFLGSNANLVLTGGSNGQVLSTDGTGNLSWSTVTVATANYANFAGDVVNASQSNITSLGTLSSLSVTGLTTATGGVKTSNIQDTLGTNTISVSATTVGIIGNLDVGFGGTGNVSATTFNGSGAGLTNIPGANVTGTVANATVASSANSVAVANVSGIGNIATINLTGSTSNVLYGNGAFAPITVTSVANANYANFAGDVVNASQANITSLGTLTSLTVSGNISTANINVTGLANVSNIQLKIFDETVLASANTGTSISPDAATGSIFRYTANNNFTFNSLSNVASGTSATVIITQDGTGNRLLTSTMKFAGNSKTLSTAASAIDIISVFYDGTTYYATLSKGYV